MTAIKYANLGLRFLLELCALAALGYWGFRVGAGPLWRVVFGFGAPLLAAFAWGAIVAPKATIRVAAPERLAVELAVFGAAAAGLVAVGRIAPAVALSVAYGINRTLIWVLGS